VDSWNEVTFFSRDSRKRRGFKPSAKEWWHFPGADEPYPDTYLDFPVK